FSGWFTHKIGSLRALRAFVGLYLIPVKHTKPPANVRLEPSF
ncbi:MAG TPA: magnesium-protoporphyrin IX monomethyl ester (oxidative) cyclase, partial [Rhodobacteraceae bacterium]|nr:magnesium-protoporphyrin IX monomethyl ester (oxidative) cyclase [Paracoccaceae bacterium]